jgi:hypothetical protein
MRAIMQTLSRQAGRKQAARHTDALSFPQSAGSGDAASPVAYGRARMRGGSTAVCGTTGARSAMSLRQVRTRPVSNVTRDRVGAMRSRP